LDIIRINSFEKVGVSLKTTRQIILDYLQGHATATVQELSRSSQVTRADVRHHIGLLVKEGVVEAIGRRGLEGRGRPMLVYSLVRELQLNNLTLLLKALCQSLPDEVREDILWSVAEHLAGNCKPFAGNLTRSLVQAVKRLNEMHYHARWEARSDGPRMIFSHCPYATILADCNSLCHLDTLLLQVLTGHTVELVDCIDLEEHNPTHCVFLVGK
jgi:predicted ArsR family transcriptional regulator